MNGLNRHNHKQHRRTNMSSVQFEVAIALKPGVINVLGTENILGPTRREDTFGVGQCFESRTLRSRQKAMTAASTAYQMFVVIKRICFPEMDTGNSNICKSAIAATVCYWLPWLPLLLLFQQFQQACLDQGSFFMNRL